MQSHWQLPFFDAEHAELADALQPWVSAQQVDEKDDRAACLEWVHRLGQGGWLRNCVPAAHGGVRDHLDSRSLVILRETLAWHSPLADFAFAMQGLGSGVRSNRHRLSDAAALRRFSRVGSDCDAASSLVLHGRLRADGDGQSCLVCCARAVADRDSAGALVGLRGACANRDGVYSLPGVARKMPYGDRVCTLRPLPGDVADCHRVDAAICCAGTCTNRNGRRTLGRGTSARSNVHF